MKIDDKRVILVTGASRGAGKGIAKALGIKNSIVYVTGRSHKKKHGHTNGTIEETAEAIESNGGCGIPVVCDHRDDQQVKDLFARIEKEQGKLDILVNNACSIPQGLTQPGPFWEKPLEFLDIMNVGMRSHYVASYYAAKIMAPKKSGLIVHTSSPGGRCYMHGPAYGAGKAAIDKFANDMAVDLKPYGIACISIWMGILKTERLLAKASSDPDKFKSILLHAETPEFTGLIIDAIANDPEIMQKSGKILVGAEEASHYKILDLDGRMPPSPVHRLGKPAQANPAIIH